MLFLTPLSPGPMDGVLGKGSLLSPSDSLESVGSLTAGLLVSGLLPELGALEEDTETKPLSSGVKASRTFRTLN